MSEEFSVVDASEQTPEASQDDAAAIQDTTIPQDTGALSGDAGPGRDYYRSQREVDAAFSRRLAAERRKWERERDGAAAAQADGPEEIPRARSGSPARPGSPARAGSPFTAGRGEPTQLPGEPEGPADGAGEATQPERDAPDQEQGVVALAARLLNEEREIRGVYPGFSADAFLRENPEAVRTLGVRPLWETALPWVLARERERAHAETVERVRERMLTAPDPLRSAGAPGFPAPDYAAMPSDQFNRIRRGFEEQMRRGKKVKP